MFRKLLIFIASSLIGGGYFFSWLSAVPAQVQIPITQVDSTWKSLIGKEGSWERRAYDGNQKNYASSIGDLLIYGQGPLPTLESGQRPTVTMTGGKWIIRSIHEEGVHIILGTIEAQVEGIGSVFVDADKKNIANFDARLRVGEVSILPSFIWSSEGIEYFTPEDSQDLIPAQIWSLYRTFSPLDIEKIYGKIDAQVLHTMIDTLIQREPVSLQSSIIRHDFTVKRLLEDIDALISKIEHDESCGIVHSSCEVILLSLLEKNEALYPDVFLPLHHAVRLWLQMHPQNVLADYSWYSIFKKFHYDLLQNDPQAQVKRDKSLLLMIQGGDSAPIFEIWDFLTKMLMKQEESTVFLFQITEEMIRLGEELLLSSDTLPDQKTRITSDTFQALSNLKKILEKTFFTKKGYLYILRSDITDETGESVDIGPIASNLESLMQKMDDSVLLVTSQPTEMKNIATLRAQLVWFHCILTKNDEYLKNARVCRITRGAQ